MYPGWSEAYVQIARWNQQRLLAECERERVIASLLSNSAARPSPFTTVRQRIGIMTMEVGRRLTGARAVTGEATAS